MPLREKSLAQLVQTRPHPDDGQLGRAVLHQMLSALDYLASKDMVHRDVKPDNILCYTLPDTGDLRFQLADFGLAEHQERATTACGTRAYQAPELRPKESKVVAKQSPKMDIWSLFATILAVKSRFQAFPPRPDSGYGAALAALVIAAPRTSLEPMARLDPRRRASAAQMLVSEFGGRGLTTPRREILPIEPKANDATWVSPSPAVGLSIPPPRRITMAAGLTSSRKQPPAPWSNFNYSPLCRIPTTWLARGRDMDLLDRA